MDSSFENATSFKQFVFDNVCQCYSQCIDLPELSIKVKQEQSICSQILKGDSDRSDSDYDQIIDIALDYFIDQQILVRQGTKFYVVNPNTNTKLKLTWENIKTIESDEIKRLLWLLRKLIVDMIIKKLLVKYNVSDTFKVYSVGSASLSSDYDITLYGSTDNKLDIIKGFQREFMMIFHEESALVFDTNLYGKAYISFLEDSFFTEPVSCNQKFYYIKTTPPDSQMMWGMIKYLSDLRTAFGEHVYNDLVDFMISKLPGFHCLSIATSTLINLKNKDSSIVNYDNLFNIESAFLNKYTDKHLGMSDYISLVNFYGVETYFTRGAFMDTVVNNQMCKGEVIELNDCDYICSILENAGFFFLHNNKTKYVKRVRVSIDKLCNKYSMYNDIKQLPEVKMLNSVLQELGPDSDKNYCKWVERDDFNLLKCEKFKLFNVLFKIVFKLLQMYANTYSTVSMNRYNFPFFYTFVNSSTKELGKGLGGELNNGFNSSLSDINITSTKESLSSLF